MKTFVKYLFIAFFLLFSTNGFAQKSLTDFIDGMKNSSNPEQFVPQIKKELTPLPEWSWIAQNHQRSIPILSRQERQDCYLYRISSLPKWQRPERMV